DVNCSIMFTELPLLQRPSAVRDAGVHAVEFWWPFPEATPPVRDVDAFISAIEDAGVQLVGLNFFAGDMPAGDRGVVSWPGRSSEFRDNVDVVAGIGERLGCGSFNALYGNRLDSVAPEAQDDLAVENLEYAASAVARIGGTVLVEPVSGADRYPLTTADHAVAVIQRVESEAGVGNLGLLADLYHLAVNGDDVDEVIRRHVSRIAHVQVADAPGRHQPGTGTLPLATQLAHLHESGYSGWIGMEYVPTGRSRDSLTWLPGSKPTPGRSTTTS
ncbi:MAG: hyi, partial [Mycobacterium sp.]|nr:hyi [Mycobacterium sp.]